MQATCKMLKSDSASAVQLPSVSIDFFSILEIHNQHAVDKAIYASIHIYRVNSVELPQLWQNSRNSTTLCFRNVNVPPKGPGDFLQFAQMTD
jgi:hypothetical protein